MTMHVKPQRLLSTRDVASLRLQLVAAEYVKRMGERIASARADKHWTQARLARTVEELRREQDPQAASIESATVSRWETGKVEPSSKMKEYLAAALEVPVSYFMMDEPDKSQTPDLSLKDVRDEFRPDVDGVAAKLDRLEQLILDLSHQAAAERATLRAEIAEQARLIAEQDQRLRHQDGLLERINQAVQVLNDAEVIERSAAAAVRSLPEWPAAPRAGEPPVPGSLPATETSGREGR